MPATVVNWLLPYNLELCVHFARTPYVRSSYMVFLIRLRRPIRRRLMLKLELIISIIFHFRNGIRTVFELLTLGFERPALNLV
jgi:hypothetical protein